MPLRRNLRPVLLTAALICLLIVLGALQYRWSGQVSEAERMRMQSSLQLAVDQFRQDFARDLSTIANGLQADRDAVDRLDWNSVAQSQTEWLQAARSHSVTAMYLLLPAEQHSLLRLDTATGTYLPAQVAPAMQPVVDLALTAFAERRPGPPRNLAWVFNGAGPFLLHILSTSSERQEPSRPGPSSEHRVGVQILALDRSLFSTKLLPELTARHFSSPDGFAYQAVIYSAGVAPAVLYNSTGAAAVPQSQPDLEADLIELRPRGGGGPDRGFDRGADRGPRDRPFGFRNFERGGERGGGRGRPFDQQRGFGPTILVSDGTAPWKIAVRHPAGSVAAAVQSLRWRNLAVSFAILLVLGGSMVIIVRNTQRAQRLAELQMEFVAGVSHEVRTPLAVISSAAENLTDGVVEEAGQVKQYGSLIRNESRRLSGMMEQILQFAAGQKRNAYKPVLLNMEEVIGAALALSQSVLTEGGFTVESQIAPHLPPVLAESGALTQCLQNLISNAAKYSGASRWIGIRAAAAKGWLTVTVEDRGIGIDRAELPHLFDAFYRAKAVRSAQIHGTGLGLNLARSFARDAGGDVTVESALGEGSSFTVRLPVAPEPATGPVGVLHPTV